MLHFQVEIYVMEVTVALLRRESKKIEEDMGASRD